MLARSGCARCAMPGGSDGSSTAHGHEPNTAETAVIMVESIMFHLGPPCCQAIALSDAASRHVKTLRAHSSSIVMSSKAVITRIRSRRDRRATYGNGLTDGIGISVNPARDIQSGADRQFGLPLSASRRRQQIPRRNAAHRYRQGADRLARSGGIDCQGPFDAGDRHEPIPTLGVVAGNARQAQEACWGFKAVSASSRINASLPDVKHNLCDRADAMPIIIGHKGVNPMLWRHR